MDLLKDFGFFEAPFAMQYINQVKNITKIELANIKFNEHYPTPSSTKTVKVKFDDI